MTRIHTIIVTHNSEQVLPLCLAALARQTLAPVSCIVVDSGSDSPQEIKAICDKSGMVNYFLEKENRGFAVANNLGFACLQQREKPGQDDVVLFLNPDCFPLEQSFAQICRIFAENSVEYDRIGAISGTLLGYDLTGGQPTGFVDSSGIFRRWYGRWYDRGQGESEQTFQAAQVPALCGAMMACRFAALKEITESGNVFDECFFLYKEDIELSLNLRKHGWQLWYFPEIQAYHCRGWAQKRHHMPYALRLMAAKNEVQLYRKHPSPYILWGVAKYLLVRLLRV